MLEGEGMSAWHSQGSNGAVDGYGEAARVERIRNLASNSQVPASEGGAAREALPTPLPELAAQHAQEVVDQLRIVEDA